MKSWIFPSWLKNKYLIRSTLTCMTLGLLIGVYLFSIFWRVSIGEEKQFGRSALIKFPVKQKYKPGPVSSKTYYSKSYWFEKDGKQILVWKEKINCFQHLYGSALSAYELGEGPSLILFNGNELINYAVDKTGITTKDILDRRKDLAHNIVGRKIGLEARNKNLFGEDADQYIQKQILSAMERNEEVYLSYLDPRVKQLPVESKLGCPDLPKKNLVDLLKKGKSELRTLRKIVKSNLKHHIQCLFS